MYFGTQREINKKMTQDTVLKLLKKKKKWMTSKEISKLIGINSANSTLNRLYRQQEVLKRVSKSWNGTGGRPYQYKIK